MTWRTLEVAYEFDRDTETPERVRASLREVDGRRFLDLRIFRLNRRAGEFRPTNRGLSLPIEHVTDLRAAVDELATVAWDYR